MLAGSFLLRKGFIDELFCFSVNLLRLLVLYVDINTIAMISCCVARHNLCSTCKGASLSHDDHDRLFGGKRVYLVCLFVWVVSMFMILPDIIGVSKNPLFP